MIAAITLASVAVAVEQVESGGQWWVESRSGCVGVMQVCPRWSTRTRAELFDPNVNREEGRKALAYWLTRSHGNWHRALAGYRCGNAGLRGLCGRSYARAVWRLASDPPQGGSGGPPPRRGPPDAAPGGSGAGRRGERPAKGQRGASGPGPAGAGLPATEVQR